MTVARSDGARLAAPIRTAPVLYSAAMLAGKLGGWLKRGRAVARAPEDDGAEGATAAPAVGALVRDGERVRLRAHVPANRAAFQRWYADEEIAGLLRHDQEPLSPIQSRGYFDSFILPLSARGFCYAIHEAATDRLIGTTALTDVTARAGAPRYAMFRILIGEKDVWGHGYGTEATELVMDEAFGRHGLEQVRLEVFRHNPRALAAYRRVGFRVTGEHTEWVARRKLELHVVEMALDRNILAGSGGAAPAAAAPTPPRAEPARLSAEERGQKREERQQERQERQERQRQREQRRQERPDRPAQTPPATPEEREERRRLREERQAQREERARQRGDAGEVDPSPS